MSWFHQRVTSVEGLNTEAVSLTNVWTFSYYVGDFQSELF